VICYLRFSGGSNVASLIFRNELRAFAAFGCLRPDGTALRDMWRCWVPGCGVVATARPALRSTAEFIAKWRGQGRSRRVGLLARVSHQIEPTPECAALLARRGASIFFGAVLTTGQHGRNGQAGGFKITNHKSHIVCLLQNSHSAQQMSSASPSIQCKSFVET
jgi:hypothetical protein